MACSTAILSSPCPVYISHVWWEFLHLLGSFRRLKTFCNPQQCMGHFSNQEEVEGVFLASFLSGEPQDQAIWCLTQAEVVLSFTCSFIHHVRRFAETQMCSLPSRSLQAGGQRLFFTFVHSMETQGGMDRSQSFH